MPRKFFRRISAEYRRKQGPPPWYVRPFQKLADHPVYFAINRRTVCGALALGLFVALLPVPGHTLIAIAAALLLRVNIPVALLATLVTNPLTYGPVYYFEYRFGAWLIGRPVSASPWHFSWESLTSGLNGIWTPLWVGALVSGVIVALVAYFSTSLVWRWSTSARYRRRMGLRR